MDASLVSLETCSPKRICEYGVCGCSNHLSLFEFAISQHVGSLWLIVNDGYCSPATTGVQCFMNLLLTKLKGHSFTCLLRRYICQIAPLGLLVKRYIFKYLLNIINHVWKMSLHATVKSAFKVPRINPQRTLASKKFRESRRCDYRN